MGDFVKIAVRTATILLIVAAIVALFTVVQFPSIDYSYFAFAVGKAKAIAIYYIPYASIFLPLIFVLIGVGVASWTFYFATLAFKWIMEANE